MEHMCRGQRFCPFAVCSGGHARLVQQGLLFAGPSGWPIANHSCFSRMHSEVSKDISSLQEKSKNTDTPRVNCTTQSRGKVVPSLKVM